MPLAFAPLPVVPEVGGSPDASTGTDPEVAVREGAVLIAGSVSSGAGAVGRVTGSVCCEDEGAVLARPRDRDILGAQGAKRVRFKSWDFEISGLTELGTAYD